MYQYPYLEQFYKENYSLLLDWNSSLRPSKSCPKNGAAGVAKFQDYYQKTGNLSFTENEVLTILRAEEVADGDTIFHQNLRVMRELNFVSPVSSDGEKRYEFTDKFISFVNSGHTVDCYIIEQLMSISQVEDLTMYFNFLICVMREAALYGQVIQYRDAAAKFAADVPDEEKRREHQSRINSVYGFKGDEARNVPENYTPNISYFCHAVLRQLGILAKSDTKIDNMRTLVLTPLGEIILKKIDENLKCSKKSMKSSSHTIRVNNAIQQIYYGSPGSGKSHSVSTFVEKEGGKEFRTTFHPDSDYSSFVGSYKPIKIGTSLTYEFVPQTFTDAYVWAWKNPDKKVFLVIEEINRGNCAQIFGDLFQLLDRNKEGYSEYLIKADKDLCRYLTNETILGENGDGIVDGELKLPSNLSIIATMNTSDQSLFPMDSAFKRRWAWKYVPIDTECPDSQFKVTIGDQVYKWSSFLKEVNARIHSLSDSEDKQIGNFFIKNDVDVDEFKSKVMFYLWSEVCKEYEKAGSFFKYLSEDNSEIEFTFNTLFPTGDKTDEVLQKFMSYLGVEKDKDATMKETKTTTFVNKLVEIGLDKIAILDIVANGYPIVGTSQPHGHAFRRKGKYYIQTTIDDKDAMITEIMDRIS